MSKWWWALVAFLLVAIIAGLSASYSGSSRHSGKDPIHGKIAGPSVDPYQHKAISNVRQASLLVGGFSSYNRAAYAAGAEFAKRQHRHLGSLTIIQVIAMGQTAVDNQKKRHEEAASTAQPDCQVAFVLDRRAIRENNSAQYEAAYKDSAKGLVGAQGCPDNERVAAEAFLLSAGAFAEHYLGRDKDSSDMNLALQKLEQCITANYGESLGAQCQSEQEIEIRNKTNWETGS